ncbi:MAG: hypothetical protein WCW14_00950 [Candidatus Paceibacterota bacterium]|jgi:hypothetical protein
MIKLVSYVAGCPVYSTGDEAGGRRCMTDMHEDGGDCLRSACLPLNARLAHVSTDIEMQGLCNDVSEAIGEDPDFLSESHSKQVLSVMDLLARSGKSVTSDKVEQILSAVILRHQQRTRSQN